MAGLMKNRNVVILGVANEKSIAWGVARSLWKQGADLIFTYHRERSLEQLRRLLAEEGREPLLIVPCDVMDDDSIVRAFHEIGERVGAIHGVVHSVAFADKNELRGEYVETSREGYLLAQNSSAYSLVAVARAARPWMNEGGSIVTQSYIGARRVVPNYNVMGVAKAALESSVRYLAEDLGKDGIRINAISPGSIKTRAAGGIADFDDIVALHSDRSPLRRGVDQDEVGDATMFLLSPLSRGITGEVLHVDGGYHVL